LTKDIVTLGEILRSVQSKVIIKQTNQNSLVIHKHDERRLPKNRNQTKRVKRGKKKKKKKTKNKKHQELNANAYTEYNKPYDMIFN